MVVSGSLQSWKGNVQMRKRVFTLQIQFFKQCLWHTIKAYAYFSSAILTLALICFCDFERVCTIK